MQKGLRQRLIRTKGSGRGKAPFWLIVPVLFICLLVLLPVLYVMLRATEVGWGTAIHLLFRQRVYELLVNTGKLVIAVTLFSAVLGVATAWFIERTDLRYHSIWHVIATLPFAVPAFVTSYTWISMSAIFEGFGGAVFILTLSSYPLIHLPVAAALRGMDPTLEESARSLGHRPWKVFWKVIFPHLRPSLIGGTMLVSLHMLAEFGALSLLRFQTFTTAIFDQYRLAFSNTTAAMLATVLLVLCFFILAVELSLHGRARYARTGSGVSRPQKRIALGWRAWLVWPGFSILAFLAIGMPIFMLFYWLLHGSSAGVAVSLLFRTTGTSLGLGLLGALLTTLGALPIVYLSTRYRGIMANVADRLSYLIHALPGLVIALTLVYFSVHYVFPIYQTVLLLLIAYGILYLPLAQSSLRASMVQVPKRLEEMGRILGLNPTRVFMKVTLPIIFPGVGAGVALVFLEIMKELTATLLLIPTGLSTLAVEVWTHTSNAEYAASAPYATVLIFISGFPVYLLTMRAYGRKKEIM